jgi:hypothetical protein
LSKLKLYEVYAIPETQQCGVLGIAPTIPFQTTNHRGEKSLS